jgi:hypothetical protein
MFNDSGYHVDAWWRGKLVEECQVYINTNQAITRFFERPTREKRELSVVDHGFCMPID